MIRQKLEARLEEVAAKLGRLRELYSRQREKDPLVAKIQAYRDEYGRIKRLLDEKR
jgi:hypothetical protein